MTIRDHVRARLTALGRFATVHDIWNQSRTYTKPQIQSTCISMARDGHLMADKSTSGAVHYGIHVAASVNAAINRLPVPPSVRAFVEPIVSLGGDGRFTNGSDTPC